MANMCERCKRSMSSHDNQASCPQCRMAAGECSLDSENPCTICKEWTHRQWGGDQSEGEIIDSEGEPADPTVAGIPILDNLKMSEEEQREYDAFSLASVSVPTLSKHPWRALGDSGPG